MSSESTDTDGVKSDLAIVILAAGRGTRMRSSTPKVLHNIAGLPMVAHVLRGAQLLKPCKTIVVFRDVRVEQYIRDTFPDVLTVAQSDALYGTGFGVFSAIPWIRSESYGNTYPKTRHESHTEYELDACDLDTCNPASDRLNDQESLKGGRHIHTKSGDVTNNKPFPSRVLILYADVPLVPFQLLEELVRKPLKQAVGAIVTTHLDNPKGYGRVMRDNLGSIAKIIEDSNILPEQSINEVNTGVGIFDTEYLQDALNKLLKCHIAHSPNQDCVPNHDCVTNQD
ncbi:NTP transferase domain-containing protein, partial [Tropheryma whipplei]|uniref:NTP transferase domain-containing protein n=2 Tax=Tropheryma whipplei TaxID=2039 RepID=UPI00066DEBD1